MYQLDENEKQVAEQLARDINDRIVDMRVVMEDLQNNETGWVPILAFWLKHSKETRLTVDRLLLERIYLNS